MWDEKEKSETNSPLRYNEVLRLTRGAGLAPYGTSPVSCGYFTDLGLLLSPIPQQHGTWDMVSAKWNLPTSVTTATGHPARVRIWIGFDGWMWRIGTSQDSQGNCGAWYELQVGGAGQPQSLPIAVNPGDRVQASIVTESFLPGPGHGSFPGNFMQFSFANWTTRQSIGTVSGFSSLSPAINQPIPEGASVGQAVHWIVQRGQDPDRPGELARYGSIDMYPWSHIQIPGDRDGIDMLPSDSDCIHVKMTNDGSPNGIVLSDVNLGPGGNEGDVKLTFTWYNSG